MSSQNPDILIAGGGPVGGAMHDCWINAINRTMEERRYALVCRPVIANVERPLTACHEGQQRVVSVSSSFLIADARTGIADFMLIMPPVTGLAEEQSLPEATLTVRNWPLSDHQASGTILGKAAVRAH